MGYSLLQWNCRGIKANYDEVLLLMSKYNPSVFCLQETFLKTSDNMTFKNYSMYNHIHENSNRACGGSSIIVSNKVPHREIPLNTQLQAVAVVVTLHRPMCICSVYIPPSSEINEELLFELISQLPPPFLIVGDFNSHNKLWGSEETDNKGIILEDFLNDYDLSLLNGKVPTYLSPSSGKYSNLDLSITHPALYLDYSWNVTDDLCGSDHFPILLSYNNDNEDKPPQRYKFKKADWETFKIKCSSKLNESCFHEDINPIEKFSETLLEIADDCIPKTTNKSNNTKDRPWFDDECKKAIRLRKAALRKFNVIPVHSNLENYKILRAKARRAIREAKRKSWRNYVSKLNYRTPIKKVWNMIRKISGKRAKTKISHLKKENDNIATTPIDISNTLAQTFAHNSSSDNYSTEFTKIKSRQEKENLNFKSDNSEDYNLPFTLRELSESINKSHDTAPGPDGIHYQLLKHLPNDTKSLLLSIFNNVWSSGNIPQNWKEAIVIPIPKPDKDDTIPSNYRPISLTSCLCKTLERMINVRLIWYLESQNIITNMQSGFRKHRSTTDHLVRLETFIREAFTKKHHLVSIFFDLEKAYDTTWKHGIMKDLHDVGLKGRLPNFISNFLSNRHFNVKVGTTLSDSYEQEEGVPQGSILSVTLFSLKINSIVKALNPGVKCSLFVDDFVICFSGKHMHTIERQLQQCLNKIQDWATNNGFKFSKSKTKCVHFCNQRNCHEDPELKLDNVAIPVVEEFKFLGIIFDKKLTFKSHINYLKTKCSKALNLLKVLSHTDWGADQYTLLYLYRTLIRSKLDYGSIVYGSARKTYLKPLDTIHHQGLRIALGAFRTSPIKSLYVEANEPSLQHRREKLSLQYASRIAANPENPASEIIFTKPNKSPYIRHPSYIHPISLRLEQKLEELNIAQERIKQLHISEIPLWQLKRPKVILSLNECRKSDTLGEDYISRFHEIKSNYEDYVELYTDGSKTDFHVGCSVVSKFHRAKLHLPGEASIFTAETKAILLALSFIENHPATDYIIFSDSLSVLQSIKSSSFSNPLVGEFLDKYNELCISNDIVLCWIPGHIGIQGNEEADRAAKESSQLHVSNIRLPSSDFKPIIDKHLKSNWQLAWDKELENKLRTIKPKLGKLIPNAYTRKEQVVLTRCRIGHTRLTHSYHFNKERRPVCHTCQTPLTVKHILLDCQKFQSSRIKHIRVQTLYDIFSKLPLLNTINYLREIDLYHKI